MALPAPQPQQYFSLTVPDTWPRFLRVTEDSLHAFRNAVKSACPSPSAGYSRHERMHMREWQRAYNGLIDFARIIYEKGDYTLECNREVGAKLLAELRAVCRDIDAYYEEFGGTNSDAYFGHDEYGKEYEGEDDDDDNYGYGDNEYYGENYAERYHCDSKLDLEDRIQAAVEENLEPVEHEVASLRKEVTQLRGEVAQMRSSQAQLMELLKKLQHQVQQPRGGFASMSFF